MCQPEIAVHPAQVSGGSLVYFPNKCAWNNINKKKTKTDRPREQKKKRENEREALSR